MKGTNYMSLILCFKDRCRFSLLWYLLYSWWFPGEEIFPTCIFRCQFRHQTQMQSETHEVFCGVRRRSASLESRSEQTPDHGAHLHYEGKHLPFSLSSLLIITAVWHTDKSMQSQPIQISLMSYFKIFYLQCFTFTLHNSE